MSRPPLQTSTQFDIRNEQLNHNDAITWYGEMTCFMQWWRIEDHNAGLVARCSTCYLAYGQIADAYQQSAKEECPECYGSTFHGGFKWIRYRPAIWDVTPLADEVSRRGDILRMSASIDTTSDLDLKDGDVIIRRDNTRWAAQQPLWQEISTGFGSQRGQGSFRLRSKTTVFLEDESSVFYLPFVDFAALDLTGWKPYVPDHPHVRDQDAPEPRGAPRNVHAVAKGNLGILVGSMVAKRSTFVTEVGAGWGRLIGQANPTVIVPATAVGAWGGFSGHATAIPEVIVTASASFGVLTALVTARPQRFAVVIGGWGGLVGTVSATGG